jgi:hypothetical protein
VMSGVTVEQPTMNREAVSSARVVIFFIFLVLV